MLHTTTNAGLHSYVAERVLSRYAGGGVGAVDLGKGRGGMGMGLKWMGCEVVGVDRDTNGFRADLPHVALDLDGADFSTLLGASSFHLVTAIEVIEHVESPIGFLRNVGRLLAPGGVGVLTTPNVNSLPARFKFFLTWKLRTMDASRQPTHIS